MHQERPVKDKVPVGRVAHLVSSCFMEVSQVEIPSQQMSIEALMITIELYCTKCSGKRGHSYNWIEGGVGEDCYIMLYPAGCSQDRRKRERASDRSDSGVATEGGWGGVGGTDGFLRPR